MALSELGAFFQRHREEQDLTLDEVEEITRIRRRYLEAIEAGDWDSLPPSVYTRGLLRSYARALGVSANSVLRMYIKERPAEARLPDPQLISQPLIEQPRFNFELLLAGVLLLAAAGLFGWIIATQLPEFLPQLTQADATGSTPTSAVAAVGERRTAVPTKPATMPPRRSTTVPPKATRTPKASPTPAGITLQVEAMSDTWLRVRTDGEEAYADFLLEGETRTWEATEIVTLRTGNAGGTQVTVNGQKLDPLGASASVEEREWRLLPNGDIEQREL